MLIAYAAKDRYQGRNGHGPHEKVIEHKTPMIKDTTVDEKVIPTTCLIPGCNERNSFLDRLDGGMLCSYHEQQSTLV